MAGETEWKLLELPLFMKIVRQYHIYGRIPEISATVKDWTDAVMVIPTMSPFNLPIYLWKADETCIITVDFCKLNQAVTLIAAVVPDVLSLLKQISRSSCTWLTASNKAKVFSSIAKISNVSVNGRVVNILRFMGRKSVSQLLNLYCSAKASIDNM